MKEATGELNVTVITVVAIAAVAALFMMFLYPKIRNNIANTVNDTGNYHTDNQGIITDTKAK